MFASKLLKTVSISVPLVLHLNCIRVYDIRQTEIHSIEHTRFKQEEKLCVLRNGGKQNNTTELVRFIIKEYGRQV